MREKRKITLEAHDTRSERCHGTRATLQGWPTRKLTNPDRSGGTGGQAMVRGNAGVQLFHAEGRRFTEQRMRLLGV